MRHCLVAVVVVIVACKGSEPKPTGAKLAPPAASGPTAGQPVQPGQLKREPQGHTLAVIAAAGADLAALEKLARDKATAEKLTIEVARSTVRELELTREAAQYLTGGVPAADFDTIDDGVALLISVKQPTGLAGLRGLSSVVDAVASKAKGWVVDPSVSGMFTAATFHDRVPGPTPDVRKLIVVHAVSGEEEQPFLDTMGMTRLGFPELFVPAAATGQVDAVTQLINATAQGLIMRGDISRPGELDVDLASLDGNWYLDDIKKAGGTGRMTWIVKWTRGDQDPSHNDSGELALELVPKLGRGTEGLAQTIDTFYGKTPDPIAQVAADDAELLAAAERARKELGAQRKHFATGIPVGEQLIVKAPFSSPDGEVEWMWVDVHKWRGNELTGTLDNEPQVVTSLRAGARVTVKLSEVADYLHVQGDGPPKGGYSMEILRKRGAIP